MLLAGVVDYYLIPCKTLIFAWGKQKRKRKAALLLSSLMSYNVQESETRTPACPVGVRKETEFPLGPLKLFQTQVFTNMFEKTLQRIEKANWSNPKLHRIRDTEFSWRKI